MSRFNPPRVSVIIPTYNRANILSRAIDSVLDQTFSDFELFIIDDASTDETERVVNAYDDDRLRYMRHDENAGNGGIARNIALERVESEFVSFLDDDDVWLPTKLEKQVALIEDADHDIGLVYCWMDYCDGETIVKRCHPEVSGNIFKQMLDKNAITAASTHFVKKSVIDDVGAFDPDLPRGIDSDFVRRVTQKYEVDYVPEVLVEYNIGHEYDRDSDWDESGIRNAIVGAKHKFEKFPEAFERYPDMKASNLAYIGAQYLMVGSLREGGKYFGRALLASPTTWRVYFQIGRAGKFYFDRYWSRLRHGADDYRVH